ncbi:unnamed protein product [Closterium sp. NIES-53]
MLLAPEGDPDAPDIPTPRSYAEAIAGEYSSQWQTAMDAEMASWKSTGTYVDEVPPPGANIVSGMWIFRVKRLPGSPPVFKARTAFLQGSLHEEIWLRRPPGFTGSFPPGTQWSLRNRDTARCHANRDNLPGIAFLQCFQFLVHGLYLPSPPQGGGGLWHRDPGLKFELMRCVLNRKRP